jgi:hypothetical protein
VTIDFRIMNLDLKRTGLLCAWAFLAASVYAERELTTDRPDATESPFTVEPGRIQLEASIASYTRDRHNPEHEDVRVTAWNVAPFNVRFGLTPASEIQVVVDSYLQVEGKHQPSGLRVRQKGFGDVTLRYKHNIWGNDEGSSALAVMPFVKIPTNTDDLGNDSVEGGLIVPYASDLGGGWSFGAMTELDVLRNDSDDGYELVWLNTTTVGRDLTDQVGVFFELALEVGIGKPAATFNTGLTYSVSDDIQLDAGVFWGITRAAPDLTVFTGFTTRF